jgi:hypothetical protein
VDFLGVTRETHIMPALELTHAALVSLFDGINGILEYSRNVERLASPASTCIGHITFRETKRCLDSSEPKTMLKRCRTFIFYCPVRFPPELISVVPPRRDGLIRAKPLDQKLHEAAESERSKALICFQRDVFTREYEISSSHLAYAGSTSTM